MSDYTTIVKTLMQQTCDREDGLPLRNESCRSRFFLKSAPTQRVCLFFHGFTAAPYQFVPMGETFFKAGYNVLVPLMPGHGQGGDWNAKNPAPLPVQKKIYQDFVLHWLDIARTLGQDVIVGGLSAGGTLAAWLALERPQQIYRAILFAPYLSSSSRVVDMFTRALDTYFEWQGLPETGILGYSGFALPALRVFLDLGQIILQRAQQYPAPPLFTISSESDIAVDNYDHRTLAETVRQRQPQSWYHLFSRVLDIPHTMMTVADGNKYQNLLITMTKAFVESNLTWAEVEEIGYRMAMGKTFPAVVAELNLTQKVSRDMPAMMTMVDKRSIVQDRQGFHRRI
ncbi:alpha/beta hydrolase [Leptolyngbya sp. 'hensonii']|uniref:alpha/beta hydrolase n=1 Tax=Leptolyngbya sp. 'hensonii' TaxID=1922337 RepID=UPI00094FB47F|nr:alpha/beta fold hydrolase [Leptolyngbya sp. 'hensonii']OLP17099.1 alpha/beta hydrolase [Leptolyngbya sp. 'hensonii']